jgi:hypothetical protein
MLQLARPIWVRAEFPHITLSLKIENKKPVIHKRLEKN